MHREKVMGAVGCAPPDMNTPALHGGRCVSHLLAAHHTQAHAAAKTKAMGIIHNKPPAVEVQVRAPWTDCTQASYASPPPVAPAHAPRHSPCILPLASTTTVVELPATASSCVSVREGGWSDVCAPYARPELAAVGA